MLEFNRILQHYDSLEEAINDFDLAIGLDITKSVSRTYHPAENGAKQMPVMSPPRPSERRKDGDPSRPGKRMTFAKPKIDERNLPLAEKVKLVIIEDPAQGVGGVIRELNSDRFGFTKLGWLAAYRLLRKLSLETKEKRFRFYRSR
jgi:hypothetical protein